MRKDGEHAAVRVAALGKAELHQQVAHVRLDRALAQHEPLGDPGVGETLGHQLEHLPLAIGELGQRIIVCRSRDEARDHLRIERRASACHSLGRREELGDFQHAILQQVAEATERDELDRMARLDVLGEEQDAEPRVT